MNTKRPPSPIVWPLVIMLAALAVVLAAHRGIPAEARPAQLAHLTGDAAVEDGGQAAKIVVACAAGTAGDTLEALCGTLEQMRMPWRGVALEELRVEALGDARTLLICAQDLSPVDEEELARLIEWVAAGGRMALTMTPVDNGAFAVIRRKLGICESTGSYGAYHSLRYVSGLLPLWGDEVYDAGMEDYALTVRLEADCVVHIETGDEYAVPLLWSRRIGQGRVAVLNATLMQGKDARGYAVSVLFALEDAVVYPIINAGMTFIDDFPAPQPEGFDERLLEDYGYDIQGFFRNHWWPDMKKLTWDDGLRYTGVLIETYNDNVEGPYEPDGEDHALTRYYASELIQSGGELGLHGYNHMPLCLEGFPYAGEGYTTWPSEESMAEALRELVRYGGSFLPAAQFAAYVPPSNYLSAEGQKVLLETVSQIRTISGLYLPETGVNALVQEFCEQADGSVSVPRISSGFAPDDYNRFVIAQELVLHGVFSHFIHPDDVLDEERGAALGWESLYASFCDLVKGVKDAYPPLRWCTASEGSAAVQRYDRLRLEREYTHDGLRVTLAPFYDEAWLALRLEGTPKVEGGESFEIGDGLYWIRADQSVVEISWEAGE